MMYKNLIIVLLFLYTGSVFAQKDTISKKSSPSKFDKFNAKAEALFKILPVPIYSYTTEAGNIYGLAKYNIINLSKKDTISKPSKLSELVTFSSKGRVNIVLSSELVFQENKYVILGYVFYQKQPQYIFGIGNDVTKEDKELIDYDRVKFYATNMMRIKKDFYVGIPIEIANYYNIETPSDSFLVQDNVTGLNGGYDIGTGLAASYDSRDNRYNPQKGYFGLATLVFHPEFLGSTYKFTKFELDLRKYFNPWLKHVIAVQAYTSSTFGNTPCYDLSLMGGDTRMRGYYLGAYRDKALVDSQIEYRAPIWNIFGVVGFLGVGRVFEGYENLTFDAWRFSYGAGLRIRVDTKNNTNLRLDFGFGENGIKGTYISFSEAF